MFFLQTFNSNLIEIQIDDENISRPFSRDLAARIAKQKAAQKLHGFIINDR
jgi:hypothetical protein